MGEENQREWHFDFVVSGITEAQADEILRVALTAALQMNGTFGGGFHPEDQPEEEHHV